MTLAEAWCWPLSQMKFGDSEKCKQSFNWMHPDFHHQRACRCHNCHSNFSCTQHNTLSAPQSCSLLFSLFPLYYSFSFSLMILLVSKCYCCDFVILLESCSLWWILPDSVLEQQILWVIGSCLCVRMIFISYVLHAKVRNAVSMIDVKIAVIGTRCGIRWVAIVLSLLFNRRGKLKLPTPLLSVGSPHLCLFLFVSCHRHLIGFPLLQFLVSLHVQWQTGLVESNISCNMSMTW